MMTRGTSPFADSGLVRMPTMVSPQLLNFTVSCFSDIVSLHLCNSFLANKPIGAGANVNIIMNQYSTGQSRRVGGMDLSVDQPPPQTAEVLSRDKFSRPALTVLQYPTGGDNFEVPPP